MMEIPAEFWVVLFPGLLLITYLLGLYFKSCAADIHLAAEEHNFTVLSVEKRKLFEKKPFPNRLFDDLFSRKNYMYKYRKVRLKDADGYEYLIWCELQIGFALNVTRLLWHPRLTILKNGKY